MCGTVELKAKHSFIRERGDEGVGRGTNGCPSVVPAEAVRCLGKLSHGSRADLAGSTSVG